MPLVEILCTAAGSAVLKVIEKEKLQENAHTF
jgi:4-aminobutyrate aminotransferase-like enzyme